MADHDRVPAQAHEVTAGTFTAPDQCGVPAPATPLAAEGKAFALGSFGLVPPFHTDAP